MKDVRQKLSKARKIVLKLGSSVLTRGKSELDPDIFNELAQEVSRLEEGDYQFVIVSSGAIAAGKSHLRLKNVKKLTIPEKQSAASVGQAKLMHRYEEGFAP